MIRSIITVLSLIMAAAQLPIRVPEPIRVLPPTRLPDKPITAAPDHPIAVSRISGRVSLRQTGSAIEGLTVWALRKGYNEEGIPVSTRASWAVTDEQGRFDIPLTNEGRYYVMSAVNLRESFPATF